MKKIIFCISLLLLLAALLVPGQAEQFVLDENALISGMNGITWYQGYAPAEQYGSYSLCLPIRCDGVTGSITAALTLDDPNQLVFSSAPQPVTVVPRDGLYPLRLSLPLSQYRRNGDYAAHIVLTGQSAQGDTVTEAFPLVVRIRRGLPGPQPPRPEITLQGQLRVGEECTLRLSIRNGSSLASLLDGELTLTDDSGDVVLSGGNCLALPEILPGETAELDVAVTVKASAAVEMHSFTARLTCKVLEEEKNWESVLSHPVTQEIRLELGSITLPSSVVQGDVASLAVPLMNMGKGELSNAMVSLEFPELSARQSVLVGTIKPGETGQAKLTFSPGKATPGEYSGTIQISCEDRYGNSRQQSVPVQITVEEAKPPAPSEAVEQLIPTPGWLLPALAAACLLLLIGMILQGWLLRARLHKLEEEKL